MLTNWNPGTLCKTKSIVGGFPISSLDGVSFTTISPFVPLLRVVPDMPIKIVRKSIVSGCYVVDYNGIEFDLSEGWIEVQTHHFDVTNAVRVRTRGLMLIAGTGLKTGNKIFIADGTEAKIVARSSQNLMYEVVVWTTSGWSEPFHCGEGFLELDTTGSGTGMIASSDRVTENKRPARLVEARRHVQMWVIQDIRRAEGQRAPRGRRPWNQAVSVEHGRGVQVTIFVIRAEEMLTENFTQRGDKYVGCASDLGFDVDPRNWPRELDVDTGGLLDCILFRYHQAGIMITERGSSATYKAIIPTALPDIVIFND